MYMHKPIYIHVYSTCTCTCKRAPIEVQSLPPYVSCSSFYRFFFSRVFYIVVPQRGSGQHVAQRNTYPLPRYLPVRVEVEPESLLDLVPPLVGEVWWGR